MKQGERSDGAEVKGRFSFSRASLGHHQSFWGRKVNQNAHIFRQKNVVKCTTGQEIARIFNKRAKQRLREKSHAEY